MTPRELLTAAAGALALAACDPVLPTPAPSGEAGGSSGVIRVTPDPEAPLDAAPRVLRLRIEAPAALDPGRIALIRGDVGPSQLRRIGEADPSEALAGRILPALTWHDGAALILAPTAALDPGGHYTLALGEPEVTVPIDVAAEDEAPLLRRVWPPADAPAIAAAAVWCADAPLPPFDGAARLDPGGPEGTFVAGAVPGGSGARCLHFEARAPGAGDAWVPPPALRAGDTLVRLDPGPLRAAGGDKPEVPLLSCEPDEIGFGPGCAQIADDRLFGRAPGVPLLWAVAGAGVDSVLTTGPSDPFTITGLPPATDVTLDVAAIDARGTLLRMLSTAVTTPPMPHVVLNEALANPTGPEPTCEWIEVVNDGSTPADLGLYLIHDGAPTALPEAALLPGNYALIVNEDFDEQACGGPAVAKGAQILRVPHLGKNGLANAGEVITLRDGAGAVISSLPASPRPKAGKSLARLWPAAPDASASSFALAEPSPGSANAF